MDDRVLHLAKEIYASMVSKKDGAGMADHLAAEHAFKYAKTFYSALKKETAPLKKETIGE